MLKKNISLLFLTCALIAQGPLLAIEPNNNKRELSGWEKFWIAVGLASVVGYTYEAGREDGKNETPSNTVVVVAEKPAPQTVHVVHVDRPQPRPEPQTILVVSPETMRQNAEMELKAEISGGYKSDDERIAGIDRCVQHGASTNVTFGNVPALNLAINTGSARVVKHLVRKGFNAHRRFSNAEARAVGNLIIEHIKSTPGARDAGALMATVQNAIDRNFYGLNPSAVQAIIMHRIDNSYNKGRAAGRLAVVIELADRGVAVKDTDINKLKANTNGNLTSLVDAKAEEVSHHFSPQG